MAGYQQTSKIVTIPPPLGGWNARDPLTDMAADDAIVLDNLIPGTGAASLRQGFAVHCSTLGDNIETLMEYSPPSGSNKLFAAVSDAIYDVTSTAPVGVAGSKTNGRWQHTMFATLASNYLVCANGADAVLNYDGASWTAPSLSGATSANLIGVTAHVQRLWFIEKDKLDLWYLPIASIAGTLTKLVISPFCKLGGYLVAIGSWSRDGGSGPNDLLVLVTSKGEVVIYSGTNPDFDNGFSQVGVFRIAEPIGRRCLVRAGSDIGILTSVGVVPLSKVLINAMAAQEKESITDKIRNAFAQSYSTAKDNFGWQIQEYPKGRLLFVNIPIAEGETQYQYVMNIRGNWCRFTGLNAGCWSLLGDGLYFGGNDGIVYKYGPEYLDVDTVISAVVHQSYSEFKTPQIKHFKGARPRFLGPEGYEPAIEIRLDYDVTPISLPSPSSPAPGTSWDEGTWDVSSWTGTSVPSLNWQSVYGIGQAGSIAMAFSLSDSFALNGTDLMFELGAYH